MSTLISASSERASFFDRFGRIAATIIEAVLLAALSYGLNLILSTAKLSALLPNQDYTDLLKFLRPSGGSEFILFAFIVVIALPVIVELLLRGIPKLVWNGAEKSVKSQAARGVVFWILGVFGAALTASIPYFAIKMIDRVLTKGGEPSAFAFFWLPSLFLVGLWSWRVTNFRGLRYSILLLVIYNLCTQAPLLLGL